MPLFTIFVVAAVMTGAGAMLSPAWHTEQPRIGLSAAFLLALLVGGAVFWTEFAGWDTLIIDYLLFAIVTFVVLGGTLSQAQARAEALGETLPDAEQGWTSRKDLMFMLVAGILFTVPALAIHLPLGDAGTLNAYLGFSAREGLDFSRLLPYHPDVIIFQAPGFHALSSYLSQQLEQSVHSVQFGVGAVIAWLCVWVMYDLGSEIADKRTGRMMALAFIFSTAPMSLLINGHYTVLLGLLFSIAAAICMLRYQREGIWMDMVAGGLLLGAVLYSDFTMFVLLLLAYGLWLIFVAANSGAGTAGQTQQRTQPAVSLQQNSYWIGLVFGIPGVALAGTAPWLWNNLALFAEFAPGDAAFTNPAAIFSLTGFLFPGVLAGLGLVWRWARLREAALFALACLLIVLLFVVVGVPGALSRFVDIDMMLWAGLLLPGSLLAGIAFLWGWQRFIADAQRNQLYHGSEWVMTLCGIALLAGVALVQPVLEFGQDTLNWQRATAGVTQLEAMEWLQANSDPDTRILNDPALLWAASVTERDVVNVPLSLYFSDVGALQADADLFAWVQANPDEALDVLRDAGIAYVLSPAAIDSEALAVVYSDDDVFVYEVQG